MSHRIAESVAASLFGVTSAGLRNVGLGAGGARQEQRQNWAAATAQCLFARVSVLPAGHDAPL